MITHQPWIGNEYKSGLLKHSGQKIAIVGYSHYSDKSDTAELTNDTVRTVISGEHKHQFFSAIPAWFGYEDLATFWNSVLFFNSFQPSSGLPKKSLQTAHDSKLFWHNGDFWRSCKNTNPTRYSF